MKTPVRFIAIGTAALAAASLFAGCNRPSPPSLDTVPVTVVTTVAPTTQTTVNTTVSAVPIATTTKIPSAKVTTTATPTTAKTTATTAKPTATTQKVTTTVKPTTTQKATTTKKPTTTTIKVTTTRTTTTTAKPTAPTYTVTDAQLQQIRDEFLRLVNEERVRVGAAPLSMYSVLQEGAEIRSREVIGYWSHNRPDGSQFNTVIDDDRYLYWTVGENLCQTPHFGGGYYNESHRWTGSKEQIQSAAQWTFNMFKDSPGHYKNMIAEKFEDTGIGVSYAWVDEGIPMFYTAQLFGAGEKM